MNGSGTFSVTKFCELEFRRESIQHVCTARSNSGNFGGERKFAVSVEIRSGCKGIFNLR